MSLIEERLAYIENMAAQSFAPDERAIFTQFAQLILQAASAEVLQAFSPSALAALLREHFAVLKGYDASAPNILLYQPSDAPSRTFILMVMRDRPFLVDTLRLSLEEQGYALRALVHTILHIDYDAQHKISQLSAVADSDEKHLSVMFTEIDRLPEEALQPVKEHLSSKIKVLDSIVGDWQLMQSKMQEVIGEIEQAQLPQTSLARESVLAFLRWVLAGNFTFLGYRNYTIVEGEGGLAIDSVGDSGLGVLRGERGSRRSESFSELPAHLRALVFKPQVLLLSKSKQLAPVHRAAYMDFVSIQRFNDKGEVIGEHRFIGLFTASAYHLHAEQIPVLRDKVAAVIGRAKLPDGGHAEKKLRHILNTFPRDDLFQADVADLYPMVMGILHLYNKDCLRFFARVDSYERFVSCLVYVPREKYSTELRLKLQAILLEAYQGKGFEYTAQFSDVHHVRLHVHVRTEAGALPLVEVAELEARLSEAMRDFDELWAQHVKAHLSAEQAAIVLGQYQQGFSAAYRADFSVSEAVEDSVILHQLTGETDKPVAVRLLAGKEEEALLLKVYGQGEAPALTEILPVLEHFGVCVREVRPYYFSATSGRQWLQVYDLQLPEQGEVALEQVAEQVEEGFVRVWQKDVESDRLNALVLSSILSIDEVVILRALAKYMLQAAVPFSFDYIQQSLNRNRLISEKLIAAFHAKMQPEYQGIEFADLMLEIEQLLANVRSLDEDRIIRWYMELLQALLRTNFYQRDANGRRKNRLVFKFAASEIDGLPKPKPKFEIFVYSPRVEAVHLRGGMVARGGLRWSDRMEDFRTEVLGLVKAQMVKNAVIVPVGSKGGFVVKTPTKNREAFLAEGLACYQTFIRGLLDVTDNLVAGKVVAPENTVRHDGDDPYLVVAADKGTASFSDVANAVAAEYEFWLGDAFASGGSYGYDHKGMGITARGGWESVKRHFRLLGKDIQTRDAFSCIGIGDMSGDVFGNGMLLSEKTLLLAAFNHLHIFIDPTPDAQTSYAERKRLFEARLGWGEYDKALISEGGGVFSRQDKEISITPAMREAFAIEAQTLTPNQLIKHLLQAPVDLIWNGGIGTYVKHSEESHAQVGDRANDAVRIDGCQLRAKVVGEGGNLGFTQRGRIEAAQQGVRLITDAIDNSGGVNCSDHEVNIKILLNQVAQKHDLSLEARNALLAEMTDEVAQLVLRQNYLQPQVIELALQSSQSVLEYGRVIQQLEQENRLDRAIEYLPDNAEIALRAEKGQTLTRPELAVLLAYSKMWVYEHLLASTLPDAPYCQAELGRYFPARLSELYAAEMAEHRLSREIISTYLTNSLVNRMGIIFPFRMVEESGRSVADVMAAYALVREVFVARQYWSTIESLDNQVSGSLQIELELQIRALLEHSVMWCLRHLAQPIDIEASVARFAPAIAALLSDKTVLDALILAYQPIIAAWQIQGLSKDTAAQFAILPALSSALDWVLMSEQTGKAIVDVVETYLALSKVFSAQTLLQKIAQLPAQDYWERRARNAQQTAFYAILRTLTQQILQSEQSVLDWQQARAGSLAQIAQAVAELAERPATLASISVLLGELSGLSQEN